MDKQSPRARVLLQASSVLVVSLSAHAQEREPPERPLGQIIATSAAMPSLASVRELPDGRVLVNDVQSRRLVLCSEALDRCVAVADTSPETKYGYGPRPAGLIAAPADSTLLVTPASLSMLVLDPSAKVVRIAAAPRAAEVAALMGGPNGSPGFDQQQRLVYRSVGKPTVPRTADGRLQGNDGPDSMPLVRFDFVARRIDTAAFLRIAAPSLILDAGADSHGQVRPAFNPMPTVDDWAVLANGKVAVVRGADYHIDIYGPNGLERTGKPVPFRWKRLTTEDKRAIVDSARAAMERSATGAPSATPRTREALSAMLPPLVPPDVLADYRPAFAAGAVKPDAESRLWVRTINGTTSVPGPLYDVIDQEGRLTERVRLPVGTVIVGFGGTNTVYLAIRDVAGVHLVKARVK